MNTRKQSQSRRRGNPTKRRRLLTRNDLDVVKRSVCMKTRKSKRNQCKNKPNKQRHRYFTDIQVQTLQSSFEKNTRLHHSEVNLLVRETGLQESQVKTWFRNRRARPHTKTVSKHQRKRSPRTTNKPASPVAMTTVTDLPPNQAVGATCAPLPFSTKSVVISHNQKHVTIFTKSDYYCPSTIQLCDSLLQRMFGYDWIVKLRLNRHT